MLSQEKTIKIKEHLLKQLDNFPENQRELIKEKILSLSPEEMEIFLKENKLNYENNETENSPCIFCLITGKKIKSFIIEENEKFLVVLEINPLSKAHTLIVPKKHFSLEKIQDFPNDLIKSITERIKKKFKPEEIKIEKNEIQGHAILEIIPIYKSEKLEKKKASDIDLQIIQKELTTKEKEEEEKGEKLKETKLEKIKLRTP